VTVPLPPGTVTVVANASAPGPAVVYQGTPATPNARGAQTLVSGGDPVTLRATAQLEVLPPTTVATTTVEATTTTLPPTTALPATEVPPTTVLPTTVPPPTALPATEVLPTTVPLTTAESSTTGPPLEVLVIEPLTTTTLSQATPLLPRTGGGGTGAAYLATALLVGGIGLLGTLRRRDQLSYTPQDDAG
jgi:carboxypeptidase N regulatory subunit